MPLALEHHLGQVGEGSQEVTCSVVAPLVVEVVLVELGLQGRQPNGEHIFVFWREVCCQYLIVPTLQRNEGKKGERGRGGGKDNGMEGGRVEGERTRGREKWREGRKEGKEKVYIRGMTLPQQLTPSFSTRDLSSS